MIEEKPTLAKRISNATKLEYSDCTCGTPEFSSGSGRVRYHTTACQFTRQDEIEKELKTLTRAVVNTAETWRNVSYLDTGTSVDAAKAEMALANAVKQLDDRLRNRGF